MVYRYIAPLFLVLATSLATAPRAQETASGDASESEKRAAIRELIEVSQQRQLVLQMQQALESRVLPNMDGVAGSREDASAIIHEELTATASDMIGDLVEVSADVWGRHFTIDEIRELTEFYRTPLGQKLLEKQPLIMQEGMQAGQMVSRKIFSEASRRIEARLKDEGLTAPGASGDGD